MIVRRAFRLAAGVAITAVLWVEVEHWLASRRGFSHDVETTGGTEAVVVLGFRNRGRRANYVNRYRVRAGLRSRGAGASRNVLVLCGGGGGVRPEARLMEAYARGLGYAGAIRLELQSGNTWENIRNAIPLIEHADSIKIVSNSLHALRAREYVRQLRPDLAQRLRPARDYRFGEVPAIKLAASALRLRTLLAGGAVR